MPSILCRPDATTLIFPVGSNITKLNGNEMFCRIKVAGGIVEREVNRLRRAGSEHADDAAGRNLVDRAAVVGHIQVTLRVAGEARAPDLMCTGEEARLAVGRDLVELGRESRDEEVALAIECESLGLVANRSKRADDAGRRNPADRAEHFAGGVEIAAASKVRAVGVVNPVANVEMTPAGVILLMLACPMYCELLETYRFPAGSSASASGSEMPVANVLTVPSGLILSISPVPQRVT
jgi:hypothetical protein